MSEPKLTGAQYAGCLGLLIGIVLAVIADLWVIQGILLAMALSASDPDRDQYLGYLVAYMIFTGLAPLVALVISPRVRMEWLLAICASPLVLPACMIAYLWLTDVWFAFTE